MNKQYYEVEIKETTTTYIAVEAASEYEAFEMAWELGDKVMMDGKMDYSIKVTEHNVSPSGYVQKFTKEDLD